MNRENYTQEKHYTIYALILYAEENFVYIGKTTSPRISAVYSRHICGGVAATDGYLNTGEAPKLYILEQLQATNAAAYKHIVAWTHIFQQNGYAAINHDATLEQSFHLLPETQAIVDSHSAEPLAAILTRTYIPRPADANRKPAPPAPEILEETPPPEIIQMNIRINKPDKQLFDTFCQKRKLNQREGFSLLLDAAMESESSIHFSRLLEERQKTISSLEKENQKLRKKLSIQSGKEPAPAEATARSRLAFQQTCISNYLKLLFPDAPSQTPLKEYNYRRYLRDLPCGISYDYPKEDGFLLFFPEAILWGNSLHRACFVIGHDPEGNRYKLRCYPKKHFLGQSFRDNPRACEGSRWYVAFQRAADGAMDLTAALPLPPPTPEPPAPQSKPTPQNRPSLDNMIHSAKIRRG